MLVRTLASSVDPATLVFAISGHIDPEDVPRLCGHVCTEIQAADPRLVICDLGHVVASDAVTVEALARLQLAASRRGCKVKLRDPSPDLLDLLELVGLDEVVPVAES